MEKIITISRQYGSGGRQIGKKLAEKLGIPFYDRELIECAASKSGIHLGHFAAADQNGYGTKSPYAACGTPYEHSHAAKIYLAQQKAILEIASKGACVIVGRGACEVLHGKFPVLRVFIYADMEKRIQRVVNEYRESPAKAEKHIRQVDKKRMSYYSFYQENTNMWMEHFDLCVDSGTLGEERAVQTISEAYCYGQETSAT